MNNLTQTKASIFLTDYASYNNGTQFEFGHWVDLENFEDAQALNNYITNHLEECDKKSPLDNYGSVREEPMFTDFEGFPESLYSESGCNFDNIYKYLFLEGDEKKAVVFILEQGEDIKWALENYENVRMFEDDDNAIYYEFEELYPEVDEMLNRSNYLRVDYKQFERENYTHFSYQGEYFLVDDNWNQIRK